MNRLEAALTRVSGWIWYTQLFVVVFVAHVIGYAKEDLYYWRRQRMFPNDPDPGMKVRGRIDPLYDLVNAK